MIEDAILYLGEEAVPWEGLRAVNQRETNAFVNDYYMEPARVHLDNTRGDLKAQIVAHTYPDLFENCFELHLLFGLKYRIGRETHLLYNAVVREDRSDGEMFRWDISAPKIRMPSASPAANLVLESVSPDLQKVLRTRLPTPWEMVSFYKA